MEQRSRRMLFQFGEITPAWAVTPPSTDGHKLHEPPPRVPTSINTPPKSDALFSSSLAVGVLVLLSVLFLLGFISLYIRRFARRSSITGDNTTSSAAGYNRQGGPQMTTPPPLSGWRSSFAVGRKGLDPAVIASMPRCAYGGTAKYDMMCPVCLSEFEEGETVKVIPYCEHVFHVECIDRWLYSHVSCPVCRATQLLIVREKNTSCSVGTTGPTQVANT